MSDRVDAELEAREIRDLLGDLYSHHDLDFRDYASSSIRRRLLKCAREEGASSLADLQEKLRHDPGCAERLVHLLTVHTTGFFRDPEFYLLFREQVVPLLRTYPFVRIWHAGCSTGEEVYSMAILLLEEGLYPRCRIYATDLSEKVLHGAKSGVLPLAPMRHYTENYLKAGGKSAFSTYYTANYDRALFRSLLRENVVFAQHNLVTDGSLNEFNVILCRNVMIYFNQRLQDRVHRLLYASLPRLGVLCLGRKESLRGTPHEDCYEVLDAREKVYRRVR